VRDVLDDVGGPGIQLLLIGEQAGPTSARLRHYYASKQNRFWDTLHKVGLTSRRLDYSDDHLLPQFGIGVTDLKKKTVHPDSSLPNAKDRARLISRIAAWDPMIVAFHSARTAQLFFGDRSIRCGPLVRAELVPELRGRALFVVTSTSPANGHYSTQLHSWEAMAEAMKRLQLITSPEN
jgi:TDG/mug DNA glycosylase family protein